MQNEDLAQEVASELNIPLEEVKDIINSTFKQVKEYMRSDVPTEFMFKFLGKFKLFPGRIKGMKRVYKTAFEKGEMTEEDYKSKLKYFENYDNAISEETNER